jgi:hypothetical protein
LIFLFTNFAAPLEEKLGFARLRRRWLSFKGFFKITGACGVSTFE